jgi:hypothetical protein
VYRTRLQVLEKLSRRAASLAATAFAFFPPATFALRGLVGVSTFPPPFPPDVCFPLAPFFSVFAAPRAVGSSSSSSLVSAPNSSSESTVFGFLDPADAGWFLKCWLNS